MRCYLNSLLLLPALALCVATMSQDAAATDRFDVRVEVLQFYAYLDTTPSGYAVEYKYNFTVDIEGVGRRTINSRITTRPHFMMPVGRTIQFHNVKKPKRKNRQIKLSANMVGHYSVIANNKIHKKIQNMGNARGVTERDLFRDADHSRDDKAAQTIAVRNGDYVMYVRVTVIEID
jgi:hypothetical protein